MSERVAHGTCAQLGDSRQTSTERGTFDRWHPDKARLVDPHTSRLPAPYSAPSAY
ncbi:hypothetical protein GQ53DRAFT_746418 [Thozetella sp. PMI_491]|nr:hypothetical protein GQ53DRAFT_746418 [Thozetella sp. PMI_491]